MDKKIGKTVFVVIAFISILFILLVILWKHHSNPFPYQEGNVVHHCDSTDWAFMDFGDGLSHVNSCKKP